MAILLFDDCLHGSPVQKCQLRCHRSTLSFKHFALNISNLLNLSAPLMWQLPTYTQTQCRITGEPNTWTEVTMLILLCFLNKQRHPTLHPKPGLAPKSWSFAKSSLTLNIHSAGEEKANSGKVQDWRQREPHVRNSFLITGNALAYCVKKKKIWFIFIF